MDNLEEYNIHYSHSLRQVIQNIEIKSDYYQTVELVFSPLGISNLSMAIFEMTDETTGRYKNNAYEILDKFGSK